MCTTGSARPSSTPTVSSAPSTNSSTNRSALWRAASLMAARASPASRTMWTPTLEPSRGGFTTNGGGIPGSRTAAETSSISARGVGTPAARKASLARFLSNARRLLATPAPV